MISVTNKNVACLGAGYVGGPSMAVLALHNPQSNFYVLDKDEARIAAWKSGSVPIYENGLQEVVNATLGKNLFFETDLPKYIELCGIIFIAVNTPTKTSGVGSGSACDLTNWELAARYIAKFSKTSKIIVEKSTVPVRTAASLAVIFSTNSCANFYILSNPEFLAEGSAIKDLENPDRILIGGPEGHNGTMAVDLLSGLYEAWVPKDRIIHTNLWSSELGKLVNNAFLAQRISSINSISAICEQTGADINEISKVVGSDSRIGPKFLNASIGFGGSCFRKDIKSLVYISTKLGLHEVADYWQAVLKMNVYQKRRICDQIIAKMFDTIKGKKIAMFGFAFKKNTGDVRESPAVDVCRLLFNDGAIVHCYDPVVKREDAIFEMSKKDGFSKGDFTNNFFTSATAKDAVQDAHAIIICTEWSVFKTYNYNYFWSLMKKPAFLFDGRNILDAKEMHDIGYEVVSIGSSSKIRSRLEIQDGIATPHKRIGSTENIV